MGKRTTLLATVALPIVSLVWQPVQAAMVRPPIVESGMPHVITVQEGDLSEAEQRKLRRQRQKEQQQQENGEQQGERRKKQRESAEGDDQQQQERQERRKKQREAAQGDEQQQQDRQKAREERRQKQREAEAGDQQQQEDRQKAREERRKKQREAAEGDDQQQQDRQKAREERRQKQREAEAGDQQQQEDRQKAREERRKKQREAAEGDDQQQQDRQKAREERRQKQREAEAGEQQQQDREKAREERRKKQREAAEGDDQQQQDRQKAREERRQKQREAEAGDQQEQDRQKAREERRKKQREAAEDQQREEKKAERPRRKRDENRERIARDPSKTNETIELPFVDGAAVLDSDKDFDNRKGSAREERRRKRAEERENVRVRVPESDRDAQVGWKDRDRVRYESGERERGERRDRRPRYEERDGWRVERQFDDRAVINFGDRIIVRSDDGRRLSRRATETYYEDLPHGRVREVIVRPNGDRVVTIRSRYGDVIQRSRIDRSGSEYVMFYAPEIDRDSRPTFVDPGERLPPMRLTVPVDDYIIDTSSEEERDYRDFLDRPPVEPVERVYTLDEVKYSARIRDKVRRIDLDTITFATGSSEISVNQAATLRKVADAINEILDKDAGETFLIEGHTDAVGSDESNLVLSDERAEAVANILTDVYDIPPENLATQGYGERFLKIDTDSAEQLNRRVTIRRVTALVKPVAMAE
ncbi:OmpA family protein [Shinella sp. CPCC 101442]|uniref:OmpA family protein n=1 Tax=Shinella sp. CPCC 101442 TaxID=2932265 RepID=UPI0021527755|nr:OmpA family protein [Shinella sp. CPCC 101442]MCR6499687.1 OmpA family protein [Shinella sp. CPCC 101442]